MFAAALNPEAANKEGRELFAVERMLTIVLPSFFIAMGTQLHNVHSSHAL